MVFGHQHHQAARALKHVRVGAQRGGRPFADQQHRLPAIGTGRILGHYLTQLFIDQFPLGIYDENPKALGPKLPSFFDGVAFRLGLGLERTAAWFFDFSTGMTDLLLPLPAGVMVPHDGAQD